MEDEMDVVEEIAEESSTSEKVVETSQETTDNRSESEKSMALELKVERDDNKALRDVNSRNSQELEFYKNSRTEEEDVGDGDDFVDRNDTEQMIEKRLAPLQDKLRTSELNMLEAQMSSVHPDYIEVVEKYGKELMDADPGVRDAVLASPNPAQTLYTLSKSHPGYIKGQENKTRTETVNKIADNLETTPTVAGSGGSAISGKQDWSKASDADVDAKLASMGID